MTPFDVRTYGRLCPALARTIRPRRRVQDGEQAGDEHAGRHLGHEQRVGPPQDLARRVTAAGLGAQDGVGPSHDQGRRDALVGHVADGDPDAAAGHLDEVVEVTTDSAGRTVVRGDLPLGQVRELARQELLLDEGRHPHLLVEALSFGRLVGLLADELRDADGRCGLRGERREEPAVVGRVVLLGEPRPEVEGPDQLALRNERHDQGDTGGAQIRDRRRVEFELRQFHRAGRRLEVGEQRIGFRDVHRDRVGTGRIARGDKGVGRGGPRRGLGRGLLATEEAADRAGQCGHLVPHPGGRASGNRYGSVDPATIRDVGRSHRPLATGSTACFTVALRSVVTVSRSTSSRRRMENATAVCSES